MECSHRLSLTAIRILSKFLLSLFSSMLVVVMVKDIEMFSMCEHHLVSISTISLEVSMPKSYWGLDEIFIFIKYFIISVHPSKLLCVLCLTRIECKFYTFPSENNLMKYAFDFSSRSRYRFGEKCLLATFHARKSWD